MATATQRLVSLVDAEDRHDIAHAELLPVQLEAANERLQSQVGAVRLLANRAETGGISEIREPADLVPLLFSHTAYKSYSESWLADGRWDRMGKWLDTVSVYPVEGIDPDGVQNLDDWMQRLQTIGHFVTCSSGTTGKPAMLSGSKADLDFSGVISVASLSWATGVKPEGDRKVLGLGPANASPRNERIRSALVDAFGSHEEAYQFPVEPITVAKMTEMITLRRKIADGTARPDEVAQYDNLSASRQSEMDAAVDDAVEALVASRSQKLLLSGMFATLYTIAQGVRAKGYSGKDFHADNAMLVGGGLKGAALPPDYKEFILDTFNLKDQRVYHLYSMQELNTPFPKCGAGRYHVEPWVMLLPLDPSGEQLLDAGGGEIEARAAFFDISLDGRWGGVISGDRITADFRTCACGHEGPTVGPDITRYADLAGGDKITCAGTIDAYVRGVS